MDAALKSHFVPALRERGFAGSLPISAASSPSASITSTSSSTAPAAASRSTSAGPDRTASSPARGRTCRSTRSRSATSGTTGAGSRPATPRAAGARREFWEFGPRSYEDHRPVRAQEYYEAIAAEALETFVEHGEPWLARAGSATSAATRRSRSLEAGRWAIRVPFLSRLYFDALRLRRPPLRVGVVVGGLEPPLWRWEHWRKIVPVMDELVALLPRPVSIRSNQGYEDGDMKDLPFGRMPWGEAGNRKWTTKYIEEGRGAGLFRPDRILVAEPKHLGRGAQGSGDVRPARPRPVRRETGLHPRAAPRPA